MGVIGGWGYFKPDGGISTFSEVLKISVKLTYRGHKGLVYYGPHRLNFQETAH